MTAILYYFLAWLRAILNCCELLHSREFAAHRVNIVMNMQRVGQTLSPRGQYCWHWIAPLTLAQEQLHAIDPWLSVRGGRGS